MLHSWLNWSFLMPQLLIIIELSNPSFCISSVLFWIWKAALLLAITQLWNFFFKWKSLKFLFLSTWKNHLWQLLLLLMRRERTSDFAFLIKLYLALSKFPWRWELNRELGSSESKFPSRTHSDSIHLFPVTADLGHWYCWTACF